MKDMFAAGAAESVYLSVCDVVYGGCLQGDQIGFIRRSRIDFNSYRFRSSSRSALQSDADSDVIVN